MITTLLKTFGTKKTYIETALNNSFKVYKNATFVYEYKRNVSDTIYYTANYKVVRCNNIAYYFDVTRNRKVTRVKMLRDKSGKALNRIYGHLTWLNYHFMGNNMQEIYVAKCNLSKFSRPRSMKENLQWIVRK